MYPDAPNEERKLVSLLRKALDPILKDIVINPADTTPVVEKLTEVTKAIADSKTPPVSLEGVESRLEGVQQAVKSIPTPLPPDLAKVEQTLSVIAGSSKTVEEAQQRVHQLLTKAVFQMAQAQMKKLTDTKNPSDYVNVRLTDGSDFYRALDQIATAIAHNSSPFAAAGTPARVNLQNDGSMPVTIVSGGGSGGTASNYNATFPATGTAVGASDGTNMKPLLVDGSGNLKIAGSFSATTAASNNNWGQALATTNGATGTIVNIASSTAGYKIAGFVGHGTGDGYWFVQIGGVTILSGRTRATQPTIILPLPNPVTVTTASAVVLKVTNESGSTADYEGTLLGL